MSTLRVYALGNPRVQRGEDLVDFPTQKAYDLMYLLLLHAGQPLERDWIAERLWPMRPAGRARRCLSTALWRLRRALGVHGSEMGDKLVQVERDTLMIEVGDLGCWFDVAAFEREVALGVQGPLPCTPDREAALRRASDLYRGDLLAGRYDDWCLAERERLRLLLLRVLKRLQRHSRLAEDFAAAIAHGERLLRLDSLQEDVHREMMRCYTDSGRPTRALEHFRDWREELRSELGVEPMRETWDLYHRIRAERRTFSPGLDAATPLASLESALVEFDRALVALCSAQEALQAAALKCGLTGQIPGFSPDRNILD